MADFKKELHHKMISVKQVGAFIKALTEYVSLCKKLKPIKQFEPFEMNGWTGEEYILLEPTKEMIDDLVAAHYSKTVVDINRLHDDLAAMWANMNQANYEE